MARKKKKRIGSAVPASIAQGESKPWYKKAWLWLTSLAVIIGWILLNGITALSNAEKLPSAASRFYNNVSTWYRTDQEWTSKWTNEGDIDARHQSEIYVDLDLLVQDHDVQGTISSGPQRDAIPLQFVLIEGSVIGNTLDVHAFDYLQGGPNRLATFKITRNNSNGLDQIKFVTTWQAQPWFPKEGTLSRAGETELLPKQ